MLLRLFALALTCALAAPGCGESRAEKAFKEQRALCLGFPASGSTIVEAERALSDNYTSERCWPGEDSGDPGERLLRVDNDVCDHTGTVCVIGWCYRATDSSLCGSFGCYYGCGARVNPKDDNGDDILDDDTVICGAQFESEQPGCPF